MKNQILYDDLNYLLTLIINSLSVIGTFFIIIMICFNKKFHTLGFYLIFNLSFSDLMIAISRLLIMTTKKYKKDDLLC
jgi:cellulose synthase/poly-beta-1,6-N-acetylglucosamine synthase-like glycosyltransferase